MATHVNHVNRWVFIHVPKTGGTSMERVLGIPGTDHLTAKSKRHDFPEYFFWGFVRHPCDRIVSAYFYECAADQKPVSLEDLRAYVSCPPKKLHTAAQVDFTHDGDRMLMDFVGYYETIDTGFQQVCEHLNLDYAPLPVANRTEHPHWTDLLTTDMIKRIQLHYAEDFEKFEYDPFSPFLSEPHVIRKKHLELE